MSDDFDFTDMYDVDDVSGMDTGYVPAAGSVDAEIREERDYARHLDAETRKRGSYAAKRDADRVKYMLSLEDSKDDADGRDVLRQAILTVPRNELIGALDLARTMRMEIKGLKKGKLVETADMINRYARYLYGLSRGIGDVQGKPSDDKFWSLLDRVHSLIDGYIYKGDNRDELVEAINSLPEKVDVIYLRDKPKVSEDFDITDGDHRQLPKDIMTTVNTNKERNVIRRAIGVDMDAIVADVVKRLTGTMEQTYKKSPDSVKQAMEAELMPDRVTRILDRVREVSTKGGDAVTDLVERANIRVPTGEAGISTEPIRRTHPKVPRAKKSGEKRERDEEE